MKISKHFYPGPNTRNTIGKFVAISKFYLCYWVNDLDTPNTHALRMSGTVERDLVTGSRRTGCLEKSWSSVRKILHKQVLSLLLR
jgi:hypothetical protein